MKEGEFSLLPQSQKMVERSVVYVSKRLSLKLKALGWNTVA